MSVIFQLFHAEDLKKLTIGQLEELKQIVKQAVKDSQDTFLNANLAISNLINRSHMENLLPASYPRTGSPPSSMNISQWHATAYDQRALKKLTERVHEVFQQLTGAPPTGPSEPPRSPKLLTDELLNQLLSQADLNKLEQTAGLEGRTILAWALTCELANFNAYEAFERVKQRAEDTFIRLTNGQRPKGPDTPYSPFYPGSPLYPDRS